MRACDYELLASYEHLELGRLAIALELECLVVDFNRVADEV